MNRARVCGSHLLASALSIHKTWLTADAVPHHTSRILASGPDASLRRAHPWTSNSPTRDGKILGSDLEAAHQWRPSNHRAKPLLHAITTCDCNERNDGKVTRSP